MSTETDKEEKTTADESFDQANMFDVDTFIDKQQDEEDEDLKEFAHHNSSPNDEVEEEFENEVEEEKEEKEVEEKDEFNFDGKAPEKKEEEKETDEDKLDLEAFNKKFSTDYKSEKELKDFLKGQDDKKEVDEDEAKLTEATAQIDILSPFLELTASGTDHKIDDEALMRSQFESIAMQDKKDLNDEEVQIEIEEQIQELRDSGKLYKQASMLRNNIKDAVASYNGTKSSIETKRTEAQQETEKQSRENLQNEFIGFHSAENFYGIDLDKKSISEVYQKVASGEFLENLKTDNKAIAELALMAAFKEKIFKKSTGLTYSDGIKAVVDEFKTTSKSKDNHIASAQRRGTAGSAGGMKGLIADILYTKPKKENKK